MGSASFKHVVDGETFFQSSKDFTTIFRQEVFARQVTRLIKFPPSSKDCFLFVLLAVFFYL